MDTDSSKSRGSSVNTPSKMKQNHIKKVSSFSHLNKVVNTQQPQVDLNGKISNKVAQQGRSPSKTKS